MSSWDLWEAASGDEFSGTASPRLGRTGRPLDDLWSTLLETCLLGGGRGDTASVDLLPGTGLFALSDRKRHVYLTCRLDRSRLLHFFFLGIVRRND